MQEFHSLAQRIAKTEVQRVTLGVRRILMQLRQSGKKKRKRSRSTKRKNTRESESRKAVQPEQGAREMGDAMKDEVVKRLINLALVSPDIAVPVVVRHVINEAVEFSYDEQVREWIHINLLRAKEQWGRESEVWEKFAGLWERFGEQ